MQYKIQSILALSFYILVFKYIKGLFVVFNETLLAFGFAQAQYEADPNDRLRLVDGMITNAVRCVPLQNKPLPAEIATCRRFLSAALDGVPNAQVIPALGRIAHERYPSAVMLR